MFTNEQRAHDIALLAAKTFIDTNKPAYKSENGYQLLVSDIVWRYTEAYEQTLKELG